MRQCLAFTHDDHSTGTPPPRRGKRRWPWVLLLLLACLLAACSKPPRDDQRVGMQRQDDSGDTEKETTAADDRQPPSATPIPPTAGDGPVSKSTPPPHQQQQQQQEQRTVQKLRMVKLFFATDRTWTGSEEQPKWFGPEWNDRKLTYGTCTVSIPPKHEAGEVEKPSIFKLELKEDPEKHVVVHQPMRLEEAKYFAAIREAVTERSQKEITVFIHGFNNTFDEAASRLGVLAFDMDFNGVPVLYSWSSQGGGWGTAAYARDEEVVELTVDLLAQFLGKLADEGRAAGATRINVIAHSMGNRALVGALNILARDYPGKMVLDEVVMAAPDVKKIGFVDGVWPKLRTPAKRYTLYASDDDKALMASYKVHTFSRIGQGGANLLLIEGLDTVDATGCDFSMLGLNHSYFGSPQVVEDLKELLSKSLTPAARKLREKKRELLLYWLLPEIKP